MTSTPTKATTERTSESAEITRLMHRLFRSPILRSVWKKSLFLRGQHEFRPGTSVISEPGVRIGCRNHTKMQRTLHGTGVAQYCPFALFGCIPLFDLICLNSPELHCWLSSHPRCIKMLGLCFRVYVRRSQGAGTDPAKDSMPRACRRGQGLPSGLPNDRLCLHLVVIDCMFVVGKVFGTALPKTACPGHAIVS